MAWLYYECLLWIVGAFIRFFHWEVKVQGYNKDLKNRPVLFVLNHQNTFLDPLYVPLIKKIHSTFLTRADVFKPPIVDKILYSFQMLPIFRIRDGEGSRRKNNHIFRECVNRLAHNEAVIIFAEGSHDLRRHLRPLKTGFAKIVFLAEEMHDWDLDVLVVPVGLNFEKHTHFGKNIVINFGAGIPIKSYKEMHGKSAAAAVSDLKERGFSGLKDSLIHLSPMEHYPVLNKIYLNAEALVHQTSIRTAQSRYNKDKPAFDAISAQIETGKGQAMLDVAKQYFAKKEGLGLSGCNMQASNDFFSVFAKLIFLLLTFPLHVLGLIFNYIPFKFGHLLALRSKDKCFMGPFWFVFWMLGSMVFHGILLLLFALNFSSNIFALLLFYLVVLLTGRISTGWWRQFQSSWGSMKVFLKKGKPAFKKMKDLEEILKAEIVKLIALD